MSTWNLPVQLFWKPPGPGKLAVSLPPSTIKLFDAVAMTPAIDSGGFIRSTGNTVWWGSDHPRVESFAPGARGWQVDLQQLSEVMRAHAGGDRVVMTESPVDRAIIDGSDFVLDCTGRAGVLAKDKDVREYDDGPKTIALVGEWRTGPAWTVPDDSHTVIESYSDGWMWSVPVAPRVRHVSAMVDPQRSALMRGGASQGVYLSEIAKTKQFKRLLADATLAAGPWGWDATPYRSREYAGDNWMLVGDAASFIDPLSSAGVQKALASAWLAAVVTYTCVTNPSMRAAALAFYAAREREIEKEYSAAARMFLSEAAAEHRHAFWCDRAVEAPLETDETATVYAAFQQLKDASELRLSVSPRINFVSRPCVEGREIVMAPHLVVAGDPAATRYLYNIDMPALMELAPRVNQVSDLLAAYVERQGRVDLHDFLMALSTAVARRWLVRE